MPQLDWDAFAGLPGAAEVNFEQLCRGAVRLNYGRYGQFVARASQPGIEFHLHLHTDCALGEANRWFGWQCRWWDLPGGTAIGNTRRGKIEEAIRKTERDVPGLTDWVLVTRRPLTAGDQEWFYKISSTMRLELATSEDVENWLTGDADVLRGTYFGDLILTPDRLADRQRASARSVGDRWIPEVHQTIDAERAIRRALGEEESWSNLTSHADELTRFAIATANLSPGLSAEVTSDLGGLVQRGRSDADLLQRLHSTLVTGDLDAVDNILVQERQPVPARRPAVIRRLRTISHPAATTAVNLVALIHDTEQLLIEVSDQLASTLTVVLADAGCGKTQLSAELTAPHGNRPAGVLMHGRDLGARDSLDDLARRMIISTNPVPSFEALLAALDAAGQRAHARLPLIIDGLNEAQDPRDWRPLLAEAEPSLAKYPYVLLVCTLRGEFSDFALPSNLSHTLEIPGFGVDAPAAVTRYFTHYKIVPGDAAVPYGLFRHPLSLRVYCETVNPTRSEPVGVERLPYSLAPIFSAYLDVVATRIAEISPAHNPYQPQDVRTALSAIGRALWERRSRDLPEEEVISIVGDQGRPWAHSMLRALEENGILVRRPRMDSGGYEVSVIFDQLAGHLVASYLVSAFGFRGITGLMQRPETTDALAGPLDSRHPLGADILDDLAALLPRAGGPQLWEIVDDVLTLQALRAAADLEAEHIDAQTVDKLAVVVPELASPRDIFNRLRETRASPKHPLNALFLDRALRAMTIADRDLRWSEWLRAHAHDARADLDLLEQGWRVKRPTGAHDSLHARWVMWTLTSTVRDLRDEATRALYWYGRNDPAGLFSLALDALNINDPYVAERVTAAAYGVAMAHQGYDVDFEQALKTYLTGLQDALTTDAASTPTSHALTRHYVAGTAAFAAARYPNALPTGLTNPPAFVAGPAVTLLADGSAARAEADRTLKMDFHNYTLGRLFPHRRNYDMDHAGHREATAHVASTVWHLGWRQDRFGTVDRSIAETSGRRYQDDNGKIDRYGKKYGWIGFHIFAGVLGDRGDPAIRAERFEVDIDPSFPEPLATAPFTLSPWARPAGQDEYWLKKGSVSTPDRLIHPAEIGHVPGPWILADGFLEITDPQTGRNVFGLLTAVLVDPADVPDLTRHLSGVRYPGRDLVPEAPDAYYVFASEIPWSPEFNKPDPTYSQVSTYSDSVIVSDRSIEMEIVAHSYAWEYYHSVTNQAAPAAIPSKPLSTTQMLNGVPQSFDQVDVAGAAASITVGAPEGFSGYLLYIREDVLRAYAGTRAIVFFGWGERRLHLTGSDQPSAMELAAYQKHQNVWRIIKSIA